MSDRAALLAAIRQFPDEDTPRLMYADWLDEHGESEHAAFIRVMIERDRLDPSTAEWRDAHARLGPLWDRGTDADGFMVRPASWGAFDWSRGFVEVVRGISAADWIRHADAILAEHPVRRVRLTSRPIFEVSETRDLHWSVAISAGAQSVRFLIPQTECPSVSEALSLSRRWPGIEFELPQPAAVPPAPLPQQPYQV